MITPTINLLMALTVGGLYAVGFYLLLQRSLMRVLIGVVVLGHGTNLLLQFVGGPPARAPIVGSAPAPPQSAPPTFPGICTAPRSDGGVNNPPRSHDFNTSSACNVPTMPGSTPNTPPSAQLGTSPGGGGSRNRQR